MSDRETPGYSYVIGSKSYSVAQSSLGTGLNTATAHRTDTPPESESKLRNVVTMAEELLGSLHASISHLESRLDTVLTPIPTSPATPPTSAPQNIPVMSHVLGRAVSVTQSLQDAISRVQSLRDRVEI